MPYGKAADLGWYQVFDHTKMEQLIAAFRPSKQSSEYFRYLPAGWRRSTAAECADATVFDIHHAKGYDADYAAAARAVCCVELKK